MNAAPFSQIVVWEACLLPTEQFAEFEEFILHTLKTRAKVVRVVFTKPDVDKYGTKVPETGGRSDVLFAVHEEDIGHFAVARLQYGMRWLDDVYLNGGSYLYDADVRELVSWNNETPSPMNSDDDIPQGFERPGINELLNS